MRIYPVYTVIAEKFHAMVVLGDLNSRIKDFYDVYIIANALSLESSKLEHAINATFERRSTSIGCEVLLFSEEFKTDINKQKQWAAFVRKSNLDLKKSFAEITQKLDLFLQPICSGLRGQYSISSHWIPKDWDWIKNDK